MANLIAQTQENVQTAQNQLQDFTDTCNSEIKKFLDASTKDDQNFHAVNRDKEEFSRDLEKTYKSLDQAAVNFSVYTPDFYTQYTSISKSIDNLHELSKLINDAQYELKQMLDLQEIEKASLLKKYQLVDSGIHNLDIIEFINHFTITADKQEAGNLAGITVSNGASSGEITFF